MNHVNFSAAQLLSHKYVDKRKNSQKKIAAPEIANQKYTEAVKI